MTEWERQYRAAQERFQQTINAMKGMKRDKYGFRNTTIDDNGNITSDHTQTVMIFGRITKPGRLLYSWEDIKVTTTLKVPGNRNWITFRVDKINEEQGFDLLELIEKSGIKKVSGANDQERYYVAAKSLWEYLINNGLFPYPVEIYDL